MLIDLLSMSNYVHFNVKLAHILGLNSSIYLGQIMDINEKAIRKEKIDKNFFTIDREYITKRTTISEKEQKEIENNLIKIGVLERSTENADTILLNITVLTSILMSPDEELVRDISSLSKPKQKRSKADAVKDALKQNIVTTNLELRSAYFAWIDAVYDKDGYMTKTAVVAAQARVDEFSNRNLDIALKVLEIAAINGYRDITWAINAYNKDYKVAYSFSSKSAASGTGAVTTVTKSTGSTTPTRKRLSDAVF